MKTIDHLHVEDGENPKRSGFETMGRQAAEVMNTEDREIWLEKQQNHLLDNINDGSFFYSEFPPLPDFPCMSSSSSSSSTRVPVKEIACSSSASTASSSSSAASWAVLKSDAEESMEKRKNYNYQPDQMQYTVDTSTVALSSTASMEMAPPLDDSMDGVDCMDVMENFGYMDLLDNSDFFDPSNMLSPMENYSQQDHKPPQQEQPLLLGQEEQIITEEGGGGPSEDLANVFLDWLKNNKEMVSAEDLRKVKIKKSTIECAAKRLGGGKEGMKQLLKLILEWVQTNHLQKRRIKESLSIGNNNQLPFIPQEQFSQNPNPTPDSFAPLPDPNPCFNQTPWMAQPAFAPDQAPGFPPMVGYMDPYSNVNVAPPPPHPQAPYHPQTEYHMLDSAQTWSPSQFAMATQYNAFAENNFHPPPPPPQPAFLGYGNQYPYQYVSSPNDQRLARLGSSATREARKKRMARQRRFSSHHRTHGHHHNQQSQNQSFEQHARLGNDNCGPAGGNWAYWQPVCGGVGSAPPSLPGDAPNYHRQSTTDRRQQGWKSEKNLRFLLQKVLKQSDVGSLGRIVLPKKEAETHLPGLEARDGISIAMEDIGTSRVWNMRYRFWPNNKSRMYLLENTGDFVRSNGLQEGDFIVIYSDVRCGKYLIRGVKVRQPAVSKGGAESETKPRPGKSLKNHQQCSPSSGTGR